MEIAPLVSRIRSWLRSVVRRGIAHHLLLLSMAAAAGILVADAAAWHWAVWLGLAVAGGLLLKYRPGRGTLLLFCALAYAFAHGSCESDALRTRLAREAAPGQQLPATLTGVVTDLPGTGGWGGTFTFPCRVETLHVGGTEWTAAGRTVMVRLHGVTTGPVYGQRVTMSGQLERPAPAMNPGEFSIDEWLHRNGRSAAFNCRAKVDRYAPGDTGLGSSFMQAALHCREWISRVITRELDALPDAALIINAMVLGSGESTPEEITDAFRDSGTIHIFSVSGLHVAMFMVIVQTLLSRLNLRPHWQVLLAVSLVFFYVFVTGMRPSAWRAAIMLAALLAAPLFGSEGRTLNSLGLAALGLLAFDTQHLFQPGFTLSFAVLLSITVLQPVLQPALMRAAAILPYPDPYIPASLHTAPQLLYAGTRKLIVDSIAVSTGATIGSLFLLVPWFRMISPGGIIANLVLVFLSGCILTLACVSQLAALAQAATLSAMLNHTNSVMAAASISFAKFFAAIPGSSIHVDPSRLLRSPACEVTVLALDHGAASILIDTPSGRRWLIDTGGNRQWLHTVKPFLIHSAVNEIEGLLLTHKDAMHQGNKDAIADRFTVRQTLQQNDGTLAAGMTLTLDPDISLRVLFPPPDHDSATADDACAVLLLDSPAGRILFTGDAGFGTEKALLEMYPADALRADILVQSRHGDDMSGLPEFLNAVQPRSLIVSDGHFPAGRRLPAEWKSMVEAKGITLYDQTKTGAVILQEQGRTFSIKTTIPEAVPQPARP